jgi:hypothetical protein
MAGSWQRVLLGLLAVVVVTFGAVRVVPAVLGGDDCDGTANAIVCENARAATPWSQWTGAPWPGWDSDGAGDESIQGFATDMSVNHGETIDFKVSTDASAYTIDIYRLGWYGGEGARKVATVAPTGPLPQTQPACVTDPATEIFDCGGWAVSASWHTPADAVSGVYLAKLTRTDTGGASQIVFVVRADESHSDMTFQTSDPSWQAYNTYGGADFYQGAAHGRAYKVSYNRPMAARQDAEGRSFFFSNEYPMIRFLERNGYDVTYSSGVDTDRHADLLKNHQVFLSVGHDEYWSEGQRAGVEAARDAGMSLAFFSGNEAYWKTRWEPSQDGANTPYRTLVCYKETWSDAKIDPSADWTGTWRDPRFTPPSDGGRPENSLTGTLYMSNDTDLAIKVSADQGGYRFWRNTSLALGSKGATLAPHTVGYESDEDVDNGHRPPGLIWLSTTTGETPQLLRDYGRVATPGTTTHHLTLYRAKSGSLVFSAGTIQWAWGLDANHDGAQAPADPRMQQATVNLFADMGVQPATLMRELAPAVPSVDDEPPATTITSPKATAEVKAGDEVTVQGAAIDEGGGVVAAVEVSTDGGATWHPAIGTGLWTYTFKATGPTTVMARGVDDSANVAPAATLRLAGP